MIRSRTLAIALALVATAGFPAGVEAAESGGTILGMEPATAVAAGIGVAAGALLIYEIADDDDEQDSGGGEEPMPPPTTTTTPSTTVTTTTTTGTGG